MPRHDERLGSATKGSIGGVRDRFNYISCSFRGGDIFSLSLIVAIYEILGLADP